MIIKVTGKIYYELNCEETGILVNGEYKAVSVDELKNRLLDDYRDSIRNNRTSSIDSVNNFEWEYFEAYQIGEDELMRRAGMPTLPGLE